MKKILTQITALTMLFSSNVINAESTYMSKIDNYAIVNSVLVSSEELVEPALPENTNNFGFSKIECGGFHCYAIKDGELYSVGYNG